jgi:hypothetical protein
MDMVNSCKKNSTESANFNHKNFPDGRHPGFDVNLDKSKSAWMSKDIKPRDYLTQYVENHSQDPGPIYEVALDMTKQSINLENSPKYRMHKTNIPTVLEAVQKHAKAIPGVGKYNIATKPRVLGTYTQKNTGGTFTDAAIFKGMSTPSHYPAIDLNKYKNRSVYTTIYKPTKEDPSLDRISKIK